MPPAHHLPLPELYVSTEAASALAAVSRKLPCLRLDARQAAELDLLMDGGMAPLRGYMTRADWQAVGAGAVLPWPLPWALDAGEALDAAVQPGDDIALHDEAGRVMAVMSVTDRWTEHGRVLLGGRVKGLSRPSRPHSPNRLRALFRQQDRSRVLAVHPAGTVRPGPAVDLALNLARSLGAALLIQPLPGGPVAAVPGATVAPLPVSAPDDPRAVLWQGLVARNHGATHFLVSGDVAARTLYLRHRDALGIPAMVTE